MILSQITADGHCDEDEFVAELLSFAASKNPSFGCLLCHTKSLSHSK